MADWNKEHGDVTTILIPAENSEISSTLVREKLHNGQEITGLVDEDTLDSLLRR